MTRDFSRGECAERQGFFILLVEKNHPLVVIFPFKIEKSNPYLVNDILRAAWETVIIPRVCNLSCTEFFEIPLTGIRCFDYGWSNRDMIVLTHNHIANQ